MLIFHSNYLTTSWLIFGLFGKVVYPGTVQEEREERERLELIKMVKEGESNPEKSSDPDRSKNQPNGSDDKAEQQHIDTVGKLLVIKRRVIGSDGNEKIVTETIKKPEVVEAYLKIKTSKTDVDALRLYVAENSDEEKLKVEKLRRERRRLQEQIRRTKKNKERLNDKDEKLNRQLSKHHPAEVWDTDEEETFDNDSRNDDLVKVSYIF